MNLRVVPRLAALLCALTSTGANAVDFSLSGYGTLGWAQSDAHDAYLRYIDDRGSLERDSVFGAQATARFVPSGLSATMAVGLSYGQAMSHGAH